MNLPLMMYVFAGAGVFALLLPYFLIYILVTGKHREGLANRLGYYRREIGKKDKGTRRIWMHAASVGEVAAAVPIIAQLAEDLPEAEIILSTTTEAGQAAARATLGMQAICVYAPVDLLVVVALALRMVQPDALVFVSRDLWWSFIPSAIFIPK